MTDDSGSHRRPLPVMPDDVRQALEVPGVMEAYEARPAYRRNAYLM